MAAHAAGAYRANARPAKPVRGHVSRATDRSLPAFSFCPRSGFSSWREGWRAGLTVGVRLPWYLLMDVPFGELRSTWRTPASVCRLPRPTQGPDSGSDSDPHSDLISHPVPGPSHGWTSGLIPARARRRIPVAPPPPDGNASDTGTTPGLMQNRSADFPHSPLFPFSLFPNRRAAAKEASLRRAHHVHAGFARDRAERRSAPPGEGPGRPPG